MIAATAALGGKAVPAGGNLSRLQRSRVADGKGFSGGVGVDASFRNFRIWEALPNPEWAKNKESILATLPPAKK